jgi:hypothetical protein
LFIVQSFSLNNFSDFALLVMINRSLTSTHTHAALLSALSAQTYAEIFQDGAPIRCRYLRVQQALDYGPLKRAKLYEKLASGEIKSFCLKEKGALKGIRLIDRDSYDAYLQRAALAALGEEQAVASTEEADSKARNPTATELED